MGNTALGAAAAAKEFGFSMIGVVPQTISRAKDDKLRALGVNLVKIAGGGGELLRRAAEIAKERNAYFVHPHLDRQWTDGYQVIAEEILGELPDCRSLVFPVGGGGLLMGLTEYLLHHRTREARPVRLLGCEAYNYPTYASFSHERSTTIADGLILETPHPLVQQRIHEAGIPIELVSETAIRDAMKALYWKHGLIVEPSSAITVAFVQAHQDKLEEPACVVLTGANITSEDHARLIADNPS
jgi:threonine dehydratase